MISNKRCWLILAIAAVTILPFIGLTEFNTKGEPREAVVALSMINDGNWILPINNGGDIPYKPPFFHWLIALFSLLPGYVSEFTARLPSALALIIMVVAGYRFFARRGRFEQPDRAEEDRRRDEERRLQGRDLGTRGGRKRCRRRAAEGGGRR